MWNCLAACLVQRVRAQVILQLFAGAQDLDHDQIAKLVDKKLLTPSSYAKPSEGGWADNKFKDIRNYLNLHRVLQEQLATPVALV